MGVVQDCGKNSAQPSGTGNSYTFTPSTPFTSGHWVVVLFSVFNDTGITLSAHCTVTINGVTATRIGEKNNDSFTMGMYAAQAGSGSAGVTISFDTSPYSGGGVFIVATAIESDDITSIDSGSFASSGSTTSNAPSVTSGSLSNASERMFTIAGTGNNQTVTTTVGGSDHLVYDETNGSAACPGAVAWRPNDGTTSAQTITWSTSASTKWAMMTVGAVLSGGGTSVALTGQSETASAGTVKAGLTKALSGQAQTDTAGTIKAGLTKALTGSQEASATGSLKSAVTKALTGSQEADTAGTIKAKLTKALTGLAMTMSQGTMTPHKGTLIALTGQAANVLMGTTRARVARALTGLSMTMSQGTLTPGGGKGKAWPSNVVTKITDQRALVAAIDPQWNEDITTYEFPNGRRFKEPQNDPY